MKRVAYTMIAMIVLVGSMALAAQAQTGGRTLIANIPFQFSVGNKTLPAGDYTVRQVNPTVHPSVLQFKSKDGSASAMIQMDSVIGKAQENAKLIFRRYGNQYFFAQAWVDGDNTGLHAPKSRAERAAERELAAIKMATESVAVTARR